MASKLSFSGLLFVILFTSCSEPAIDSIEYYRSDSMVGGWMETGRWTKGKMKFSKGNELDLTLFRIKNRLELRSDSTASYCINNNMDPYWKGVPISDVGTWKYDVDKGVLHILNAAREIEYSFLVPFFEGEELTLMYTEIEPIDIPK